jgi:hypothetical protein
VTETGGLYYIHERIDQLVRQCALEVGLLRIHLGLDHADTPECEARAMRSTSERFWTGQDAAADNHGQQHREPF